MRTMQERWGNINYCECCCLAEDNTDEEYDFDDDDYEEMRIRERNEAWNQNGEIDC